MEVGTPPLHLIAPVFLRYFRAEFAISSLFLLSYKVFYLGVLTTKPLEDKVLHMLSSQ